MNNSISDIINKFDAHNDEDIDLLLSDSAKILINVDEFGKAYAFSKIIKGKYEVADLLITIADRLVELSLFQDISLLLGEAEEAATNAPEVWQQAELLCRIGKSYFKYNKLTEYKNAIEKAVSIAKQGEKSKDSQLSSDCSGVLAEIAEFLAVSDSKAEALKIATSIEDEYKREYAIKIIKS